MMQYNRVGKTDIYLSAVGFGTCQLQMVPERQAIETLKRGFELGVNWVHTSTEYGGAEHLIARAIEESSRDIMVLSQASGDISHFEYLFENTCLIFKKKRLEMFGINCINDCEYLGQNIWGPDGMVDFLMKKKHEGRLGGIFCTTHGPPKDIARVITSGVFDAVMLAYNLLGFHLSTYFPESLGRVSEDIPQNREKIFPLAVEHGISLLIMKPFAGGLLCRGKAFPPHEWFPAKEEEISASDLLKAILQAPAVCAVVPGTASIEEAEENARAGHKPIEIAQDRLNAIESGIYEMKATLCSRCGKCESTCSKSLPISTMFRDAYIWNYRSETFMALDQENYFLLHPDDSLICRTCSEKTCVCPQGLDIPASLAQIHSRMLILREKGVRSESPKNIVEKIIKGSFTVFVVSSEVPRSLKVGKPAVFRLMLQNAGETVWSSLNSYNKEKALGLAVFVQDRVTQHIPLRHDVLPGTRTHVVSELKTPEKRGEYWLRFFLMPLSHKKITKEATLVFASTLTVEKNEDDFHEYSKIDFLTKAREFLKQTIIQIWLKERCQISQTTIDEPLPDEAFKAEISIENPPRSLEVGSTSKIKVKVKNISNFLWPGKGTFQINLGDHWLDKNGKMLINDLDRSSLPRDVKPGEKVTMEINLAAPSTPGDYILEYDMVQEAVAWFSQKGSNTARVNVKVESSSSLFQVEDAMSLHPGEEKTSPFYGVQYIDHSIPDHLPSGTICSVRLSMKNTGRMTWQSESPEGNSVVLHVSCDGELMAAHKLPCLEVCQGEQVTVHFPLKTPSKVGHHTLRVELAERNVALFADRGVAPLSIDVMIEQVQKNRSLEIYDLASRINPWYYNLSQGIQRSVDGRQFPLFVSRAKGCHLWDLEDKEYIDYIMGWGSTLLGYADDRVQKAILEMLNTAPLTPFPHPIEMEVAQILTEDFPCAEMVVFGKNGSDVCTVAARLARVFTGKKIILYCGYHGWQDFWVEQIGFAKTGIPDRPKRLIHRFKFNDRDDFLRLYHQYKKDLAAVMIEPSGPWAGDEIGPEPDIDKEFLETVADLTRKAGALLVFDEIVTCYRYPKGSVQKETGITPDLACLGKALASGMPLSALVGKAHIFRMGFPNTHYGPTFKGEIYSLAAAKTAIQIYRTEPVAQYIWDYGMKLQKEINVTCKQIGINAECKGPPFRMALIFNEHNFDLYHKKLTLYQQELLKEGITTMNGVMLPSYSHNDTILEQTLAAVGNALEVVAMAERKNDFDRYLEIPIL